MPQIFISYRRSDSQPNSDRIYYSLSKVFGEQAIFKDVDNIHPGADFPSYLTKMLRESKLVLVIIGNTWASAKDDKGNFRLFDPNDFVRLEVEAALRLGNERVIPILVNDAKMPSANELPPSLQNLLRINALKVRNDPDYEIDIERLIESLKKRGIQSKSSRRGIMLGLILTILIIGIIGTVGLFAALSFLSGAGETQTAQDAVIVNTTEAPQSTPIAEDKPTNTNPPQTTPIGGSGQLVYYTIANNQRDIYLLDLGTGQRWQLTNHPADDKAPDWSPDGSQIVFQSLRDGNEEIYMMNADGSSQRNISNYPSANDSFPAWSPNGSQIAFQSSRDGNEEIYMMNADGSNQRNISNNSSGNDYAPEWSPDGSKLAFYSNRTGYDQIYIMNADGSNQQQLTDTAGGNWSPAWSPDGRSIVFYSFRDDNREIYVMNADGSSQRRLSNNSYNDLFPNWSPDATLIAFTAEPEGTGRIYIMNADGSNGQRITLDGANERAPVWKP